MFPGVQGACAGAAMLAQTIIERQLLKVSIEGGPVAWLHRRHGIKVERVSDG